MEILKFLNNDLHLQTFFFLLFWLMNKNYWYLPWNSEKNLVFTFSWWGFFTDLKLTIQWYTFKVSLQKIEKT